MDANGSASACSSGPQGSSEDVNFQRFDPARLPEFVDDLVPGCRTVPHLGRRGLRFPFTPGVLPRGQAGSMKSQAGRWWDDECCARGIRAMLYPPRALPFRPPRGVAVGCAAAGLGHASSGNSRPGASRSSAIGSCRCLVKQGERSVRTSCTCGSASAKCRTPGERTPFMANSRYMIATGLRQSP